MVGRGSKGAGGQRRKSQNSNGSRARKPAVAPIIDLEATIVEEAQPEPQAGETAASAGPSDASPEPDDAPPPDTAPNSWMKEMKAFFLGGVHIGRWRIPAAGSLLVAAIFVGGLAAGRLSGPEVLPPPSSGPLQARIAALETTLRGATASNDALSGQIDALDGKLDKVTEYARNAGSAADAALSEVRAVDAALQDLGRPGGGDDATAASNAALQKQMSELSARLDQLAQRTPSVDSAGLPESVNQRIDAMAKTLAELKTSIEQSAARAGDVTGSVAADAQALLEATQKQLTEGMAAIEARLNERLKSLEDSFTGTVPTAPGAASVAVGRLQRVVDGGKPFQSELAGLSAALPGDPAFVTLARHAQAGVPTRAAVIAGFGAVAKALRSGTAEASGEETDGGLVSDMLSKVNNLVQIRKTTDPGSRSAAAAVDAAEAQVGQGDLAGAAESLGRLGDGLPQDAVDWVAQARVRAQVDAAMAGLLRRAIMAAPEPEDS